jgi:hypothetical protein
MRQREPPSHEGGGGGQHYSTGIVRYEVRDEKYGKRTERGE